MQKCGKCSRWKIMEFCFTVLHSSVFWEIQRFLTVNSSTETGWDKDWLVIRKMSKQSLFLNNTSSKRANNTQTRVRMILISGQIIKIKKIYYIVIYTCNLVLLAPEYTSMAYREQNETKHVTCTIARTFPKSLADSRCSFSCIHVSSSSTPALNCLNANACSNL